MRFLKGRNTIADAQGTQPTALHVRVHAGYVPDVLYAPAGRPVRITFLREETTPCSERVVFPDFGKNAMLPTGRPTTVELPPTAPGRYPFTCAMNMLHGTLVVQAIPESQR